MLPIYAAVVVLSDKACRGEQQDKSGPLMVALLQGHAQVHSVTVLPDDRAQIADTLRRLSDSGNVDIILTSGGAGFIPCDITPEAISDVTDRIVPGISEALRTFRTQKTKKTALSHATAGIRGHTLIINLPGSLKAVKEYMEVLLPALPGAVETLRSEAYTCGC